MIQIKICKKKCNQNHYFQGSPWLMMKHVNFYLRIVYRHFVQLHIKRFKYLNKI